jgi:hypothetical protein
MATTAKNLNITTAPLVNQAPALRQAPAQANFFERVWNNYLENAEKEGGNRILWYGKTLLVLPCAFMVPLVIAMMHLTTAFHFYVGLLILLLFGNVVIHVAQLSGRIFVPFYHATIAIMLTIPLVTYLFTL